MYDHELLGVSGVSFVSTPVSLGAYEYVCVCVCGGGILICLCLFQRLSVCAWVLCEEVCWMSVIWLSVTFGSGFPWMSISMPVPMSEYVCGSVSCCVPACSSGSGYLCMC